MKIDQVTDKLVQFASCQIDVLAQSSPPVNFFKPVLKRVLQNYRDRITSALDMMSDENHEIDMRQLLQEMTVSVKESQPFTVNVPVVGDIELGGNKIQFTLPYINSKLSLDSDDVQQLLNYFND